ncbi:crossover junction endodeoxyribonuclease RuvC [Paenibacillus sp. FSL R7-0302]|uniref:crossover junction endodeoxyribonuclease RuvC n=1 Tax=Paenibacillus sp. FSL R7-0302 TaxID=2921681 RepID=UPI0030FB7A08
MNYLYAFDLSMDCTGLVIFNIDTQQPMVITSFPTKKAWSHGKRLNQVYEGVKQFKHNYPCKVVAIERGFSRFNTATQVIFRVHGLINWLFYKYEQFYYTPKSVKEAILVGTASKEAIQKKLLLAYPHVQFENEDESDAFAVGLTYFIKECKMPWEKSSRKQQTAKKRTSATPKKKGQTS